MLNIYSIGTSSPINSPGGSANPDGSAEFPYYASGASVAAVQTALAALDLVDGIYANAEVTGSSPILLQYNELDNSWYEPSGGHGTELSPYWTASAGEDGVDALPAPTANAYAVIGKGTGAQVTLRGYLLFANTTNTYTTGNIGILAAAPNVIWVSSRVHARGLANTVAISIASISGFATVTAAAGGGAVDYNTTTSNRVSIRSGSSAGQTSTLATGSRTSTARATILLTRLTSTGNQTNGSSSYIRGISTTDTNQFFGLIAGGTLASNATEWHTWTTNSSTVATTGIAIATEKTIEADMNFSTNSLSFYVNRSDVAASTVTSNATGTGATTFAEATSANQTTQTKISYRSWIVLEWDS